MLYIVIIGLLLLAVSIYAILNIVDSSKPTGIKVVWIMLVLLLPLIGFLIWLLLGPRGRPRTP